MIGRETFLTIERAKNGFIIMGQDDSHNRYRTDVARTEAECKEIVAERIGKLPVPEDLRAEREKKEAEKDCWKD